MRREWDHGNFSFNLDRDDSRRFLRTRGNDQHRDPGWFLDIGGTPHRARWERIKRALGGIGHGSENGDDVKFNLQNATAEPITILGVTIDGGETRDLLADGAYLEDIARSDELTEKILAGDLIGPPQAAPIDETSEGLQLEPGAIVMVSPSTLSGFSVSLPPSSVAAQVPFAIFVFNRSAFDLTLTPAEDDTGIPDASIFTVAGGESSEFWSTQEPGGGWSWVAK